MPRGRWLCAATPTSSSDSRPPTAPSWPRSWPPCGTAAPVPARSKRHVPRLPLRSPPTAREPNTDRFASAPHQLGKTALRGRESAREIPRGRRNDTMDVENDLERLTVSRRGLLVKGGVAAAGLSASALGVPAAAFGAAQSSIKVAVVTHGDTGSFWSVFKRGVDQAKKDLAGRGVSVTQVYANNDVAKQVAGLNSAIANGSKVIATSVPDASALRGPLKHASSKGIEIITVNSGLGAFDSLPTYMVHVGQTEDIAGQGAGKQFKKVGSKKVLIVIHEASNSGLQQRAAGGKKVLGPSKAKGLPI